MEKCRSVPPYSSSYKGTFSYEDRSNSYSFNGPTEKEGGFSTTGDPEVKRKKRVASYKVFAMEGKLKASVKNSFRWMKSKYSEMRYGF